MNLTTESSCPDTMTVRLGMADMQILHHSIALRARRPHAPRRIARHDTVRAAQGSRRTDHLLWKT